MTWPPDRKVFAGGTASVVTWLILMLVNAGATHFGWAVPDAVTTVVPLIVGYAFSYLIPPADRDIIKRIDDRLIILARNDRESMASYPGTPEAAATNTTVIPKPGAAPAGPGPVPPPVPNAPPSSSSGSLSIGPAGKAPGALT